MNLISASIHRPIAVIAVVIMVVMFGWVALQRIPIQLAPDVRQPVIIVNTFWPGASPLEVEREIVSVMVSNDQMSRIFERMYLAGRLDTPGKGYIYATPLTQAATYIPPHLLDAQQNRARGMGV